MCDCVGLSTVTGLILRPDGCRLPGQAPVPIGTTLAAGAVHSLALHPRNGIEVLTKRYARQPAPVDADTPSLAARVTAAAVAMATLQLATSITLVPAILSPQRRPSASVITSTASTSPTSPPMMKIGSETMWPSTGTIQSR